MDMTATDAHLALVGYRDALRDKSPDSPRALEDIHLIEKMMGGVNNSTSDPAAFRDNGLLVRGVETYLRGAYPDIFKPQGEGR